MQTKEQLGTQSQIAGMADLGDLQVHGIAQEYDGGANRNPRGFSRTGGLVAMTHRHLVG
jgi:hypothetical protein